MSKHKSRPALMMAAMEWAIQQSGTAAKTTASKQRAVEHWIDTQYVRYRASSTPRFSADNTIVDPLLDAPIATKDEWIQQSYLDAMHTDAAREMREEFARRARWAEQKKSAARVPAYVRYHLYRDDAPQSTRAAWLRDAGRLLPGDYRSRRIAEVAFLRAEWGRRQKRYRGENVANGDVGIRTETNGKSGWKMVSWHYADYTAIESPDGRNVWVRYPDLSEEEYKFTKNGTGQIQWQIVRRAADKSAAVIRTHHLRRYYSAAIRRLSGITWVWSREEQAGYYLSADGEQYHTEPRPHGPSKIHFRAALTAFRMRREEREKSARREAAQQRLAAHADQIFVSVEDSLAAGNCPRGTELFASELLAEMTNGYPASIRADVILAHRNDSYTQRACIQATVRHH